MRKRKHAKVDKKKQRKLGILLLFVALLAVGLNVLTNTRAKYVTKSDEVEETARVAKWLTGVTMELDLFKDTYAADDLAAAPDSVKSSNGDDVVAPGTTHYYDFTTAISGNAPEVAYRMEFDVAGEYGGTWQDHNGSGYYPLLFSLAKVTNGTAANIVENVDLATLVVAINNTDNATVYAPGETPASADTQYRISWTWPFSENDETDLKDTALGVAAINSDITVKLTATVKAVQVD